MPALIPIAAVVTAGASVYAASKAGKGGGVGGVGSRQELTPEEVRLAELNVALTNRELGIAESQAEAANASTRAGGWLKVAGAAFLALIGFLILRKKKVIDI